MHPTSRYGFGYPPHQRLQALISARDHHYRNVLNKILAFRTELAELPVSLWRNDYLPALDGACLYAFITQHQPRSYFEIGSGVSTHFVHQAMSHRHLSTSITSLDPAPRLDVSALCDQTIRQPLETADLSVFSHLRAGDILFVDDSHYVFQNSDVTVFFLEVLPNLAPGILVGLHDILLPDDYPPTYAANYYAEQYLLASYLLGAGSHIPIEFPAWYVSRNPAFTPTLTHLFADARFRHSDTHGCTFWFTTGVS